MKAFAMMLAIGTLGFGALATSRTQAALIFEHVGDTDPATEGFNAEQPGENHADPGPPANWRMVKTTPSGSFYQYPVTLADFADPSGWTFTMTAKLNSNRHHYGANTQLRDGLSYFDIALLDGTGVEPKGAYYLDQSENPIQLGTVDPTDGFHTYQIVLDPKGNGIGDDDVASWYVDGVLALSMERSQILSIVGNALHLWGKPSGFLGPTIDQQYSLHRLETGQHPIAPLVPGDFDSDGDVDGADFVAWQTNFPTASGATLAEGDADGDGDVDGADFVVWQTNFPFTPSASISSVPEPASGLLLMVCSGAIFHWRKRRRT